MTRRRCKERVSRQVILLLQSTTLTQSVEETSEKSPIAIMTGDGGKTKLAGVQNGRSPRYFWGGI